MNRIADDSIHISRPPLVKYSNVYSTEDKTIIYENVDDARFEELYGIFKSSFDYAAKAYIKNIQNNKVHYDNVPFNETMEEIAIDFSSDIEHCYGLPYRKNAQTKNIFKELIEGYKESNKDVKLQNDVNLNERETQFLNGLNKTFTNMENIYTTEDNTFNLQIDNIISELKLIQENHKDDYQVQQILIYNIINIRKFINMQNKVYYGVEENLNNFYNNKFIDEASNVVIRELARSPQEISVLNLKNISNGTSELSRLIRLNLSSFGINLNNEKSYKMIISKEKEIKNRVISKLTTKYIKDVITDDEIISITKDQYIDDFVTGKKILNDDFIKNNINRHSVKDYTGYDINRIEDLIKPIDKNDSIEEVRVNIDTLVAVWNELDRLDEISPSEDVDLVRTFVDYKFTEMLSDKKYQIELTRRSLYEILNNQMTFEINDCLNKFSSYNKAIRKYQLLSNLYGNNLNNNHMINLANEVNEKDFVNVENKLTDLEMSIRNELFTRDCVYKTFDEVYKQYDIIEMMYHLTNSGDVKKELKQSYLNNEYTINYKKVAYKSELMAQFGYVGDYKPEIRKAKENVVLSNGASAIFQKFDYNNVTNSNKDVLILEFPIAQKQSDLLYLIPAGEYNTFKPNNVLRNVQLEKNNNNESIVKAEIKNPSDYLATEVSASNVFATIESSKKYQMSQPKQIENKFMENLTKNHENIFKELLFREDDNKISNTEKEISSLPNTNINNVFKKFGYDDLRQEENQVKVNKAFKDFRPNNYVKNELNDMFGDGNIKSEMKTEEKLNNFK